MACIDVAAFDKQWYISTMAGNAHKQTLYVNKFSACSQALEKYQQTETFHSFRNLPYVFDIKVLYEQVFGISWG